MSDTDAMVRLMEHAAALLKETRDSEPAALKRSTIAAMANAEATLLLVAASVAPAVPAVSTQSELAERFKAARTERNLSLREAAEQIGVGHSVLHRLENGVSTLSMSSTNALLRWLDHPEAS